MNPILRKLLGLVGVAKDAHGPVLTMPASAGEGVAMPEGTTTVTPPAASGGIVISKEDLAALIAAGIKEAVGPLQSELATLRESVGKIPAAVKVEDLVKTAREQIAQEGAAAQVKTNLETQRSGFAADKLKGVPAIYAAKLGADPAKWAEEAKTIREGFQADLKAAGIKAPATSSNTGTGAAVDTLVDTSKLSGMQLLELGVKQNSQPRTIAPPAAEKSADSGAGGGAAK